MAACVLVVEENDPFRECLSEHLMRRGHRVLETSNHQEAFGILESNQVDVILMGCSVEGARKWALLDQCKRLRFAPPVILLIPEGKVHLSIEGMRRGAFDDIFVPFDWSRLEKRILAACASSKNRSKQAKSFRQRWDDYMLATVFAEAGDHEEARKILANRTKKKPRK